jgi:hypothetical protein
MSEQHDKRLAFVGFYASEPMKSAIKRAAQRETISQSAFVRRAVLRDLRAVGRAEEMA